ncbi:MAG: NADP-dependent oxidoreductase [Rhodanobacter sp.]|uniref:MDR family NADP-dependent oxidoreductase n=1 Tax=Rhodanobacter sp. FW021-MT20 TaxID=1162282 RepID=UPI000260C633|nr:NADP-dependent oxidoreductase [Rhodanobacter sp. 115]EIL87065.1 NADP-dependent oxidoreductase [Rhodanobacter sp. 115]TAM14336.1 MAG: NADP-dependent oxidoreductase [Rhodanobacter sp.]
MTSVSEIRLVKLPEGNITPEHFGCFDASVPAVLPAGAVRLRNVCFGVNAGMRSRIGRAGAHDGNKAAATHSYAGQLGVGDVPQSDAVAQVLESTTADFKPGDWVVHIAPWRTRDVVQASKLRRVDVGAKTPPEMYLTALGHTAFTAYVGMVEVGKVGAKDSVYVSAAAGGVGSYAAQIARLRGARVIGSTGSAEKLAYLRDELKLSAAFNYKATAVAEALAEFAPEGLSLCYDNVGGEQLEAAIAAMGEHGRIVLCGMVSDYAQPDAHGPRNLHLFIKRRLCMTGFTVLEHESARADFEASMRGWLSRDEVVVRSTVFEGIDALPRAFSSLLAGATTGRAVVRLDAAA